MDQILHKPEFGNILEMVCKEFSGDREQDSPAWDQSAFVLSQYTVESGLLPKYHLRREGAIQPSSLVALCNSHQSLSETVILLLLGRSTWEINLH
jgi:hypothetical protein